MLGVELMIVAQAPRDGRLADDRREAKPRADVHHTGTRPTNVIEGKTRVVLLLRGSTDAAKWEELLRHQSPKEPAGPF